MPMHGVDHYENFPVASWLCPKRLRAPIAAIYWFARTADDIADEGDASAASRLSDLAAYRADLRACEQQQPTSARWPAVFGPLSNALAEFALPAVHLHALLDAFEQDVRFTESGQRYANDAELLAYCAKSANPVGRLLLHLYGVTAPEALEHSDAVCSALQLINFWQDLGSDVRRGRFYLTANACVAHGLSHARMLALANGDSQPTDEESKLIATNAMNARAMMQKGSKIAFQVPGRAGWELRAVIQGGLAILRKIEAQGFDTWTKRPKLGWADLLGVAWRCLWMRSEPSHSNP